MLCQQEIIVDGYNAMGYLGLLEKVQRKEIGLDLARLTLLKCLSVLQKTSGKRIIVVFDGFFSSYGKKRRGRHHKIKFIFTKSPETADNFIKRQAISDRDLIITDDNELRRCLERNGIYVFPCRLLELFIFNPAGDKSGQVAD